MKDIKDQMQYIVDDFGVKTSVIVPFKKWETINVDYHKLQNKLNVFVSIQNRLAEIKAAKRQRTRLQNLSEFISGLQTV
jgi:uncharacterized protein YpuA (DUF1002 family)